MNNLGRARELLERYLPDGNAAPGPALQSDLRGLEWRYLWERCQSDALFELCQVSGGVSSLSASGDGHWVAVGQQWGDEISVWDLRSRERVLRFSQTQISAPFSFSPAAPLLAFPAKDFADSIGHEKSKTVVPDGDPSRPRFFRSFYFPCY